MLRDNVAATPQSNSTDENAMCLATLLSQPALSGYSRKELRKHQLEDATLGIVLQAYENNQKPGDSQVQAGGPEMRILVQSWDQPRMEDGLLWRYFEDSEGRFSHLQLILPSSLRNTVLHELHERVVGGHLGQEKMLQKLKQ